MTDPKQEVAEQLLALVPEEVPPCRQHPERGADTLCADCGALCCWECVAYDLDSDAFRCPACRQQLAHRRARRRRTRIFRLPVFYVGLTVALAIVAYALGVGNPRPAVLARQDRGKSWFSMELPHAWLKQAIRVRQRMNRLEGIPEREAEYRHWASLAQAAFNHMLESWGDSRLAPEIRLAAAYMRAQAGQPREALADLATLAPAFAGTGNPGHVAWMYHQGKICLEMGDRAAATEFWNRFLDELTPEQERGMTTAEFVEDQFGAFGDVKPEALETAMIRAACRSDLHPVVIKNRIRELGRQHGLELRPPKRHPGGDTDWESQDDGAAAAPAPVAPVAPATPAAAPGAPKPPPAKPGGPLVIERFN